MNVKLTLDVEITYCKLLEGKRASWSLECRI